MKRRGFTLIELIIIIVVVGIFIPAMFTMMQNGVMQGGRMHTSQQQLSLAEASMEEIIADKNSDGRGFTYLSARDYGKSTGLEGFSRLVEVKDLRVKGRPAKSVTVTISGRETSAVSLTAVFLENW